MQLCEIEYSTTFQDMIRHMHRGMESRPQYDGYISDQLSGIGSRLDTCERELIPEMEHHLGPLAGKRILDFGCGTGITTVCLARTGAAVVASDISEESLSIARQRLREHGLEDRIERFATGRIEEIASELGRFDAILLHGVVEHIPISLGDARRNVIRVLFDLLEVGGSLFLGDTPNRLLPFDGHTTQLWFIPWTRPGSQWALDRAIRKGRYLPAETYSESTLGLEEEGAWGATYWELLSFLDPGSFEIVNLEPGHRERVHFTIERSWKRALFETVMHPLAVRLFRTPLTAFCPSLNHLAIRRKR